MSDVNVPKLGKVNKKVAIAVGVGAAGFVGWRYWQSRNGSGSDTTDTTDTTGDFGDGSAIPDVLGAVSPDNSYGSGSNGDTTQTSTDSYGFSGTTNDQWSQYAVVQLEQSDTWSYSDIVSALGAYISGKPLSTLQMQIVQAAIAVAGHPPVGSLPLIPGGDTNITVAPTGLASDTQTSTTVHLTWAAVSGARNYDVYRSDTGSTVIAEGASNAATVAGLQPNKSYSFSVAAVGSTGTVGPKSSAITVKTKAVTLAKPATPKVSAISTTSAHVATSAVSGAQYYRWYVSGVAHGASDTPSYTLTGLKKGTKYSVNVAADTTSQTPGPNSNSASFTTKSK